MTGPRLLPRITVAAGLLVLALLIDRAAFGFFRTVTLYDHWGEMREGLTAAKFLASGLGTLVLGVCVAALDQRGWRRMIALWLVVIGAALPGTILKGLVGRERPSHPDQVPGRERTVLHGPALGIHEASCQSFPSGHTTAAFASATCFAAFYPPAAPLAYTVAGATAVNRIVKHQHFLSDVVAGAALGHILALVLLHRTRIRRLWHAPAPPPL